MNYLIVRTKLQAVIALSLLDAGVLQEPFVFLPLYHRRQDEDKEAVKSVYARLAGRAARTVPIVQEGRFGRNLCQHLVACFHSRSTGGSVFLAVVDYYGFALAHRLFPWARVVTFDDGAANIQTTSKYFAEKPLVGPGLKRAIVRRLLPSGPARYLRGRITRHYTIYPGHQNIVEDARVDVIQIDWIALLTERDRNLARRPVRQVLLGTVYEEIPFERYRSRYMWALEHCDAYLPHPRESRHPKTARAIWESESTAEAVLSHLLATNSGVITVYHFNSSVAYSFAGNERIRFIDALDEANADCFGSLDNEQHPSLRVATP
jgi:hypothetical protein